MCHGAGLVQAAFLWRQGNHQMGILHGYSRISRKIVHTFSNRLQVRVALVLCTSVALGSFMY